VNPEHVPSSPRLYRLVLRSAAAWLAVLLVAAAWLRAPLQPAADPAHAPNPAKAAWFLLWIQELVSHGTAWIDVVGVLAVLAFALPWLRRTRAERARWFAPGERVVGAVVLALALGVLALTLVALLLRGAEWQLRAPF